ncbi:MAG: MarR family transcriptional regulator [Clostridiales bacterium]|nr:MarR family transcriptional regulator [Clostridiales bacterium]
MDTEMINDELKKEYIQVLFRFRKYGLDYPKMNDVNMTELLVMTGLSTNAIDKEEFVDLAEIQSRAHISKAAISQIFTSLEKKGYVIRETDKNNRRRIIVELTPSGEKILEEAEERVDTVLNETLSRLGNENLKQLVTLMNKLSDISDDIKSKMIQD